MNTVSITKLYDLLAGKIGREAAENLTAFIEEKVNEELESRVQTLATRADMVVVKADIARLTVTVSETKSELLKWMFLFWIGQVAASFGFILLFLKK